MTRRYRKPPNEPHLRVAPKAWKINLERESPCQFERSGLHPVIPSFVFRTLHERLTVVRVCLAPAEDLRRISDQLLIEIATFGQWPATDAIEDLTPESETGVEAAVGVILRRTSDVTAEHERWL